MSKWSAPMYTSKRRIRCALGCFGFIGWRANQVTVVALVVPDTFIEMQFFCLVAGKPSHLLVEALDLPTRIMPMLVGLDIEGADDLFPEFALSEVMKRDRGMRLPYLVQKGIVLLQLSVEGHGFSFAVILRLGLRVE